MVYLLIGLVVIFAVVLLYLFLMHTLMEWCGSEKLESYRWKRWLSYLAFGITAVAGGFFICAFSLFVFVYAAMYSNAVEQDKPFIYTDEGYVYHANVEKIPMEKFSDNMKTVSADIIRQFEEYDSFSSKLPDSWYRDFTDSAKAREFIGCSALRGLSWSLEEKRNQLMICGDKNGNLQYITLETDYQVDEIRLYAFSNLYTEHDEEPCTHEVILERGLQYEDSVYRTEHGRICHVMTTSANARGYCTKAGYMTVDGILYLLHIAYLEADAAQAEDLLYQWAEQFA